MNEKKKIGVWLDHTKAHLISIENGKTYLIETVDSPYDPRIRFEGEESDVTQFRPGGGAVSNNEDRKHNRMQREIEAFFNLLEGKLKDYDEILLFGPTIAKNQLQNHLALNKTFWDKLIAIANTENHLSENQLREFVKNFFETVN